MADGESVPERVLLVEGDDDLHVVRHICTRHGSMPAFSVEPKGSVEQVLRAIGPEIKVSGRRSVGVLVDANDDLSSRWQAVVDRLARAGIAMPQAAEPAGTVTESTPRVGVWLMPDNVSDGELEDFAVRLIPDGDPVWPEARRYIDGIPVEGRKFASGKVMRARLYAWLATRKEPRRMGAAIGTGDLQAGETLAVSFAECASPALSMSRRSMVSGCPRP